MPVGGFGLVDDLGHRQRPVAGQVEQGGLDAPVHIAVLGQVELDEDPVDMPLDGAFRDLQQVGDGGVATPFGDQRKDLPLAGGELLDPRIAAAERDQLVDDPRVDERTPGDDLSQRSRQLVLVPDTFLQEVSALAGAVLEEAHCIRRLGVLAENHYPDLRMRGAKLA